MRTALACLACLVVLLLTPRAWADGLTFVDGLPDTPHVIVKLTASQRKQVEATPTQEFAGESGLRSLTIVLTEGQRRAVRNANPEHVAPRWVVAMSRTFLEKDCTCGMMNGAVLSDASIAVIFHGLSEGEPSDAETRQLAARLVDLTIESNAKPTPPPKCTTLETDDGPPRATTSTHLEELRLLAKTFRRGWTMPLPQGWEAREIKDSAIPESMPVLGDTFEHSASVGDHTVQARPPLDLTQLRFGQVSRTRSLTWPATASLKHDDAGTHTVLLAGFDRRGRDYEPLASWQLVRFVGKEAVAMLAFSASDAPGDDARVEAVREGGRTVVVERGRDAYVCEGL